MGEPSRTQTPRDEPARTAFGRVLASDALADDEALLISPMPADEVKRAVAAAEAAGVYPADQEGRMRWYAQLLVERGYAVKVEMAREAEPEHIEGAWRG
jgi:hypothetical protein